MLDETLYLLYEDKKCYSIFFVINLLKWLCNVKLADRPFSHFIKASELDYVLFSIISYVLMNRSCLIWGPQRTWVVLLDDPTAVMNWEVLAFGYIIFGCILSFSRCIRLDEVLRSYLPLFCDKTIAESDVEL